MSGARGVAVTTATVLLVDDEDSFHRVMAKYLKPYLVHRALSYQGDFFAGVEWSGEVTGTVAVARDARYLVQSLTVAGASPIVYDYDDDGLMISAGDLSLTRDTQTGLLSEMRGRWRA